MACLRKNIKIPDTRPDETSTMRSFSFFPVFLNGTPKKQKNFLATN
jgi:hypothetical protein